MTTGSFGDAVVGALGIVTGGIVQAASTALEIRNERAEQERQEKISKCNFSFTSDVGAGSLGDPALFQQFTQDWLISDSVISGYDLNCQALRDKYSCINGNESGRTKFEQKLESITNSVGEFNTFFRELGESTGYNFYFSQNPETLYNKLDGLFFRLEDDSRSNNLDLNEALKSYQSFTGITYEPDRSYSLTEEYKNIIFDLTGIKDTDIDLIDFSIITTSPDKFVLYQGLVKDILAILDEMEACAQDVWKLHENFEDRKDDEVIGQVATGRGVLGTGLNAKQRRQGAAGAILSEPVTTNVILEDFEFGRPPKEQCIFLSQMYHLVDFHRKKEFEGLESEKRELPYAGSTPEDNVALSAEGPPFGFINTLTQYQQSSNFFDATNAQIAHLQPMIRLFKVTPSLGESFNERAYEFVFNTFAEQDDISNIGVGKNKRGFGAGIKNFNFTYDGSNPFSVKKSIKANLTIYANNFSELLKQRGNIRYIDLALKTGTAVRKLTGDPELDFRIKAVVGLSMPNGTTTANFSDISKAVENNYVTLSLTPVTHTFDFDETGAVTFKIEYYAYIEEFLDNAKLNIFADEEISKRVTERRIAYKTAKKVCRGEEDSDNLQKILELDSNNIKQDKIKSLQFLTNKMFLKNKIYFLSLTAEELEQLAIRGPFYDLGIKGKIIDPSSLSITTQTISADLENIFNQKFDSVQDKSDLEVSFRLSGLENNQFAFFYLGDLLNIILTLIPKNLNYLRDNLEQTYKINEQESDLMILDEDLYDEEIANLDATSKKFEKFRFLLGPIEIVNHANNKDISQVSLSDVPISLSYFNEWLTSKLLAKEEVEYPLTQFLNDLINNLINNYLNDDTCYSYNIKQRVRLFQNCITSYGDDKNDNITNYLNSTDTYTRLFLQFPNQELPKPLLQPAGPRGFNVCHYNPNREYHFFVYYAGRVQPIDQMRGNRCDDEEKGIFHYVLGKDRGIVKTIKLQKDETPGLKEVRFEQEGYDGLRQLREIYNVKIDSVLNVSTFPGTYIFVEPKGFSPDLGSYSPSEFDLTDLGIGGYYMIINSTHELAPGVINTSFNARWVQSLDTQFEQSQIDSSGDGEPTAKCSVRISEGSQ
jgi:hypothetical protein